MTFIINLGVRVAREQWVVCTVPYLKINKILKLVLCKLVKRDCSAMSRTTTSKLGF